MANRRIKGRELVLFLFVINNKNWQEIYKDITHKKTYQARL